MEYNASLLFKFNFGDTNESDRNKISIATDFSLSCF